MSDWVQRIRDEGKKLEHRLEVAIASAEQHLSAAEGVDTVDLDAAEDRDDADAAVESFEAGATDAQATDAQATDAPGTDAPATRAEDEGSGSTTTPNA